MVLSPYLANNQLKELIFFFQEVINHVFVKVLTSNGS